VEKARSLNRNSPRPRKPLRPAPQFDQLLNY